MAKLINFILAKISHLRRQRQNLIQKVLNQGVRRPLCIPHVIQMNVLGFQRNAEALHRLWEVRAKDGEFGAWQFEDRKASNGGLAVFEKGQRVDCRASEVKVVALSINGLGNCIHICHQSPDSLKSADVITIAPNLLKQNVISMLAIGDQESRDDGCRRTNCLNPSRPVESLRSDVQPRNNKDSYCGEPKKKERPSSFEDLSHDFHQAILA